MAGVKSPLFLALVLALATGAYRHAESDAFTPAQIDTVSPPQHAQIVPAPVDTYEPTGPQENTQPTPGVVPSNFPLVIDEATPSARSIRFLSEAQMSASDRDLVADAESSIQERAGFENLDFNGSGWTYQQLDCPALPYHLFLRFTRNDGTREMTMFSAAIPRNGNGRVRIIPILRKGYSLFSPAPISAITIASFNRIRTEEGAVASVEWLGTGLCYAALAGANPNAGIPHLETGEIGKLPATIPPTLFVKTDGGAVIRFVDISTEHPTEWSMTFDSKGKLVKTSHKPVKQISYHQERVPTVSTNPGTLPAPHQ